MTHPEPRPSPDRSPESLEARLRALPRPAVPAGLEARLLAAIPAERPTPRRRWVIWAGAAVAVAAACLVAVLAWPRRVPEPNSVVRHDPPRPDVGPAYPESGRTLDGPNLPAFSWPLPESSTPTPLAIPSDLLD